jgi:glutamate formiminotransferase/formiminotetrahydrofolate cyclodeaminase
MGKLGLEAQHLKDEFLELIERDTEAFNNVMAAMRLKKKTDEQMKVREEAIEAATKHATQVPLEIMKRAEDILTLASQAEKYGNQNSVSDAGVAAIMAEAACEGGYLNVIINLGNIQDKDFVKEIRADADAIRKQVKRKAKRITKKVTAKLVSTK